MADLSAFQSGEAYDPNAVFDLELRGPDGAALFNDDGTPMTIGVIGLDSDEASKAKHAQANRRMQQGPRAKVTSEGFEADAAAFLAKLTKRWNITMNKAKPDCTEAAARELYANPRLAFIREQVDAAIADRANFTKA